MEAENLREVTSVILDSVLENVKYAIKKLEDNNLTNEQFVLDWFDKLNELSVKH